MARELAGDLRSRMGAKPGALKAEVGADLRARIAAGRGEAEGAGFSYADFKRRRSETRSHRTLTPCPTLSCNPQRQP